MTENIKELVERFQNRIDDFCSSQYSEEGIRQLFINPFFQRLEWDIDEKRATSLINREVVHEDKVKIEGKSKAPDYGFYINAKRQFFLEAKRASLDIFSEKESAFQLRRYGWSASLPISILTNFRQLAIYDCRIKPEREDFASKARIAKFGFEEYVERWDEIYRLLSRDAVQNGSLITLLEAEKQAKYESIPVDEAFLAEIEDWRMALAPNIFERNDLDIRDLNFAVQAIINRLIFLRLCEDKGIEPYGRLLEMAKSKPIYQKLSQFFKQADKRYNAGLFHFYKERGRTTAPDKWTLSLQIDDKYLRRIIQSIYDQDEKKISYEFSVIPVEILGHIYEKFLGKVIVLGKGQHPQIEEKPEVKKAGGVYYTPEYIVNYIVENTVGKLLENKTPLEISKLSILDPACGSGSFLIGAYTYLLDWHLNYYSERPEEYKKVILKITENTYQLTSPEKKRILLNNIYGVDIDQQAVEISKLSLLLKVLEGETQKSIDYQLELDKERALPDLDNNIKCGNSLINNDFYDNKANEPENEELRYRVNAFDWEEEFAEIMGDGGFDVVIGNPPWGASLSLNDKTYLSKKYKSFLGNHDSYLFFIEKAINLLNEKKGICSFITPDTWIKIPQAKKLREIVLKKNQIQLITILPSKVFKKVSANCIIFLMGHFNQNKGICSVNIMSPDSDLSLLKAFDETYNIKTSYWNQSDDFQFQIYQKNEIAELMRKVKARCVHASESLDVMQGIVPYARENHSENIVKNRLFHSPKKLSKEYDLWIQGRSISRYLIATEKKEFLKYGKWLHRARQRKYFEGPRILIQEITGGNPPRISACYCDFTLYHDPGIISCLNIAHTNILFLLGIINSSFLNWYHKHSSPKGQRKKFPKVLIGDIRKFPIPLISLEDKNGNQWHDKMVKLVEQMLILHQQLNNATSNRKNETIQRQINRTDKRIDLLVYEIYDLTPDEIAIVEKATRK